MDKDTTFRDWLAIVPFTDFRMQQYPRPSFVGRTPVPETLNDLTIGQLIELSTIGENNGELYRIPEIILGMKPDTTARMRAVEVVQFVGWVLSEVERINKLFEAAGGKPTEAEKRAGVERLSFGLFGMLDWYALRMGYKDHDEVLGVGWMRIYKCIDMDNKKAEYNKRLQEEMINEYRRKNPRSRK